MHSDFWHDKWERMEIGFHLNEVNSILLKYWPAMNIPAGNTVLVPLCGKTLDLVWLRSQGYGVVGIELSEIALDELAQMLRDELQLSIEKTRLQLNGEDAALYRGEGVLLIGGDFFAVTPELTGPIHAVYDRAALVALPPAMRMDYCRHIRLLSDHAPQLLVTFEYDQDVTSGPPFAVPDDEVRTHYAAHYAQLDCVDDRELIEQEPKFRAKGLTSFRQLVYRLHP